MVNKDLKIRLIGAGGHGILTLGMILGETAIKNGLEASMTIGYSPAQRGGWSRADVIISENRIDYPIFTDPDILIATTQETYDLEYGNVKDGGLIIYESSLVEPREVEGVRQIGINAIENAIKLGNRIVANIIILGFFNEITKTFPEDLVEEIVASRVKKKYVDLNMKALKLGREMAYEYVGKGVMKG